MSINWFTNAVFKSKNLDKKVIHSIHSLPREADATASSSAQANFWLNFFLIIGLSLIPTSSIVFIIKERELNSKHQQIIAGVSLFSYWFSNFVWDYIKYVFVCVGILLIFNFWNLPDLFETDYYQLYGTIITFIVYGIASTLFIYATNYLFSKLLSSMIFTLS